VLLVLRVTTGLLVSTFAILLLLLLLILAAAAADVSLLAIAIAVAVAVAVAVLELTPVRDIPDTDVPVPRCNILCGTMMGCFRDNI